MSNAERKLSLSFVSPMNSHLLDVTRFAYTNFVFRARPGRAAGVCLSVELAFQDLPSARPRWRGENDGQRAEAEITGGAILERGLLKKKKKERKKISLSWKKKEGTRGKRVVYKIKRNPRLPLLINLCVRSNEPSNRSLWLPIKIHFVPSTEFLGSPTESNKTGRKTGELTVITDSILLSTTYWSISFLSSRRKDRVTEMSVHFPPKRNSSARKPVWYIKEYKNHTF